jgi:hypothetical protein
MRSNQVLTSALTHAFGEEVITNPENMSAYIRDQSLMTSAG